MQQWPGLRLMPESAVSMSVNIIYIVHCMSRIDRGRLESRMRLRTRLFSIVLIAGVLVPSIGRAGPESLRQVAADNAASEAAAVNATPMPEGVWDTTAQPPASPREQLPMSDATDARSAVLVLPASVNTTINDAQRADGESEDSLLRAFTGLVRDYYISLIVIASMLLFVGWVVSALATRALSVAPHRSHTRRHKRRHSRSAGHERALDGQELAQPVKREHRRRRRHSRPTTS